MTTRFEERSHRDYWIIKLTSGMTLLVSRDSVSRKVLVSALDSDSDAMSPPQEAHFDPDEITEGTILGTANGTEVAVTKVTMIPRMAVTGRRI